MGGGYIVDTGDDGSTTADTATCGVFLRGSVHYSRSINMATIFGAAPLNFFGRPFSDGSQGLVHQLVGQARVVLFEGLTRFACHEEVLSVIGVDYIVQCYSRTV